MHFWEDVCIRGWVCVCFCQKRTKISLKWPKEAHKREKKQKAEILETQSVHLYQDYAGNQYKYALIK